MSRGAAKHLTYVRMLRSAIDRDEHVHALDRDGVKCWGGDAGCSIWLDQGRRDAPWPT